jgi:SAM-dependent methyltransferase
MDEMQLYGLGLKPGDSHYRAYVGPPKDYDLITALTVGLLFAAGLREIHKLLDVGCGSLRAGRLLIPYLRPGNYFGIEPNRWLVEAGIKQELGRDLVELKQPSFSYVSDFSAESFGVPFDYVVAQSIFSHTYPDLAAVGLSGVARSLAPDGLLLATFHQGEPEERGTGWIYPGVVTYRWEEIQRMATEAGLVARCVEWPHPRQSWFVAGLPTAREKVVTLADSVQPPRHA